MAADSAEVEGIGEVPLFILLFEAGILWVGQLIWQVVVSCGAVEWLVMGGGSAPLLFGPILRCNLGQSQALKQPRGVVFRRKFWVYGDFGGLTVETAGWSSRFAEGYYIVDAKVPVYLFNLIHIFYIFFTDF